MTGKTIVAYFSAEGKTEQYAKALAEALRAELFAILPETPYSAADIKWTNPLARCNREKIGKKDVPIRGSVEDWSGFDTVCLGFPIWYYAAPNVIQTFCKAYDWTGKRLFLFATSGGSGIGKTAEKLRPFLKGDPEIVSAGVYQSVTELEKAAAQALGRRTVSAGSAAGGDPAQKVAVITGGAHGIGKAIADAFRREGAVVHIIDREPGEWFVGDVGKKEDLERFAARVIEQSGHVNYLIHNAPPLMKGLDACGYEEFEAALAVGVTAPFWLTKLLTPYLAEDAAIVNISSSRDRMSQAQTESYTAAKGGISALTHALAISLAGKARVNSVSPGWINTTEAEIDGPDALQQPVGRVGKPEDVAELVLFLCSQKAGFLTGENICIDGGMTKQMIYHAEQGWNFRQEAD
jgi:NAD(P)-dependent dehydrogenase (short-subunit alcohol dehydrogenase family)/flavodoxin